MKKEGGLGLQTTKGRNIALLAKLNWRLHVEKEAVWAKVLRHKYCNHRRLNSTNADSLPCSQIWKGMKKGRVTFNKGSMWTVGRDSKVSFWWENWTGKGRAVHGSSRLGFGPDSNSTRLDRVIKNLTRNRPNNGSDPTVRVNS